MTSLYRTLFVALLASFVVVPAYAACDDETSFIDVVCKTVGDTWTEGDNDLYLPLHTYHLRSAYSDTKIDSFNETPWGVGYGRSRYNEKGNWDGLYGMAFLDSHSKVEPLLGYGHEWMWGDHQGLHAGLGYTVFVTARQDVGNYAPIPGILPIASVNYKQAALNGTFVPGGQGNGNIFFFWSRFGF